MSKRWDYHMHTTFSDGQNTAAQMAEQAIKLGLEGICFCDHCRLTTDWLGVYAEEINSLREHYSGQLDILLAVEAKVIDHRGAMDVPGVLPEGILQVAAIHRIPDGLGGFIRASEICNDRRRALDCWKKAVEGLACNRSISRMAHPFSLLGKLEITADDESFWRWLDDVFSCGHYLLENNVKYDSSMVPEWFIARHSAHMLPASDSHSVDELSAMYQRLYGATDK